MPQIFRVGPYSIYFWSNENNPLEPIHVHIAEGNTMDNVIDIINCIILILVKNVLDTEYLKPL